MSKAFRWLVPTFVLLAFVSATASASGASYELRVDGLACPFCAYGIEKRLNAVKGVETFETNIGEGTVVVTMEEGATLDEAMAREAVRDAGFTLRGFVPLTASPQP